MKNFSHMLHHDGLSRSYVIHNLPDAESNPYGTKYTVSYTGIDGGVVVMKDHPRIHAFDETNNLHVSEASGRTKIHHTRAILDCLTWITQDAKYINNIMIQFALHPALDNLIKEQ